MVFIDGTKFTGNAYGLKDGLEQYFKITLSLNIKYDELHSQNHDFRLAVDIFVITSLKNIPEGRNFVEMNGPV